MLENCAGEDDDLTFDSKSVKVLRSEEKTYTALFKKPSTGKNGYWTTWYHDRLKTNVAVALMQILRSSRTIYMTTWQVGFVERALQVEPMHWARNLWSVTHQHIGETPGVSANYL